MLSGINEPRHLILIKPIMSIGFLFDLDGVLIDSESEYTKIWAEINDSFPTGVENFPLVIKGQTLAYILNRYFDSNKHKDVTNMLNRLEQVMEYRMLPGARDMLEYLEKHNIPRVMVTSSNNLKMKHLWQELPELESKFSDIVTSDRISKSKPDPEGYILGASLCGAKPERCVVFEDSLQGVMAGRCAGCYVVGLKTTISQEKLSPYCDKIVDSLADIDIKNLIAHLNEQ